jgi:hypothetical protein
MGRRPHLVEKGSTIMLKMYVMSLLLTLSVSVAFGSDASKPAPPKRRMPALSDEAYKAVVAEEAKLNKTLAGCRKAANPKTCRSQAMTVYSQAVTAIVSKLKGRNWIPNLTDEPDNPVDCFGDTQDDFTKLCNAAGGKVTRVTCPCDPNLCTYQHINQQKSLSCYWLLCTVEK